MEVKTSPLNDLMFFCPSNMFQHDEAIVAYLTLSMHQFWPALYFGKFIIEICFRLVGKNSKDKLGRNYWGNLWGDRTITSKVSYTKNTTISARERKKQKNISFKINRLFAADLQLTCLKLCSHHNSSAGAFPLQPGPRRLIDTLPPWFLPCSSWWGATDQLKNDWLKAVVCLGDKRLAGRTF